MAILPLKSRLPMLPDYAGGGLLNLMASITQACGGKAVAHVTRDEYDELQLSAFKPGSIYSTDILLDAHCAGILSPMHNGFFQKLMSGF